MAKFEGAAGAIECTVCRQPIPVRFKRRAELLPGQVLLEVDTAPLVVHLRACAAADPNQGPGGVVARKAADQATPGPAPVPRFVAPGKRPCIACGTLAPTCLQRLQGGEPACCGGCAGSNTHPAPGESMPCQVWAAEHGAPN